MRSLPYFLKSSLTLAFDFHVESGNEKITSKQNSHGGTVQEQTQPDLVSFLKYLLGHAFVKIPILNTRQYSTLHKL